MCHRACPTGCGHERGWDQVGARLGRAAQGIKSTGRTARNMVTVAGEDLACTVGLERVTRDTGSGPRARTLRCTQVYRREDGQWKVVLRHAGQLQGKDEEQR